MQFRLITLFIITGIVCVYCAVLNLPAVIAFPLFCAVAWLSPAYFISGVIYTREARRAFFIGGLASGAVPFLADVLYCLAVAFDGWGRWRYRGGWGRTGFGETQLINLLASLVIFSPVIMAFLGGWVAMAVYYSAQPKRPVSPPASPFRPMNLPANEQPMTPTEMAARNSPTPNT